MKRMQHKPMHKPIIETIINSVALALTAFGVVRITSGHYDGYVSVLFGVALEYLKYVGRQRELW